MKTHTMALGRIVTAYLDPVDGNSRLEWVPELNGMVVLSVVSDTDSFSLPMYMTDMVRVSKTVRRECWMLTEPGSEVKVLRHARFAEIVEWTENHNRMQHVVEVIQGEDEKTREMLWREFEKEIFFGVLAERTYPARDYGDLVFESYEKGILQAVAGKRFGYPDVFCAQPWTELFFANDFISRGELYHEQGISYRNHNGNQPIWEMEEYQHLMFGRVRWNGMYDSAGCYVYIPPTPADITCMHVEATAELDVQRMMGIVLDNQDDALISSAPYIAYTHFSPYRPDLFLLRPALLRGLRRFLEYSLPPKMKPMEESELQWLLESILMMDVEMQLTLKVKTLSEEIMKKLAVAGYYSDDEETRRWVVDQLGMPELIGMEINISKSSLKEGGYDVQIIDNQGPSYTIAGDCVHLCDVPAFAITDYDHVPVEDAKYGYLDFENPGQTKIVHSATFHGYLPAFNCLRIAARTGIPRRRDPTVPLPRNPTVAQDMFVIAQRLPAGIRDKWIDDFLKKKRFQGLWFPGLLRRISQDKHNVLTADSWPIMTRLSTVRQLQHSITILLVDMNTRSRRDQDDPTSFGKLGKEFYIYVPDNTGTLVTSTLPNSIKTEMLCRGMLDWALKAPFVMKHHLAYMVTPPRYVAPLAGVTGDEIAELAGLDPSDPKWQDAWNGD